MESLIRYVLKIDNLLIPFQEIGNSVLKEATENILRLVQTIERKG